MGQPQDPQPPFSSGQHCQRADQSCSQSSKGKEKLLFNPAPSLRTEGCLEYLFSDFWLNSEAGFVRHEHGVITSFLPSLERALPCCGYLGSDQSLSCPFSLRTQISLQAVPLLGEGSRSIHFHQLLSTGVHRSLRRGLQPPVHLLQGPQQAWASAWPRGSQRQGAAPDQRRHSWHFKAHTVGVSPRGCSMVLRAKSFPVALHEKGSKVPVGGPISAPNSVTCCPQTPGV